MTQINTTPAQITDFFCRKGENRQIIPVQNVEEYIDDALKSKRILCEYISYDKDVNPYFDADLKIDYKDDISKEEFEFRESKLKKECLDMVANIFETYDGNYEIFEGKKNCRLLYKKGKKVSYKFSLRFWIKGIKVKPQYLKMLLDQYLKITTRQTEVSGVLIPNNQLRIIPNRGTQLCYQQTIMPVNQELFNSQKILGVCASDASTLENQNLQFKASRQRLTREELQGLAKIPVTSAVP